jgi:hypothetical protein
MTAIDPSSVSYVEIFPPIGISRLGNSSDPAGYFVGPEIPYSSAPPTGGFKDAAGNIKRQAARFRAYAFDAQGRVLGELNNRTGYTLNWSVTVANAKAAHYRFRGRYEPKTGLRNPTVQGDLPIDQRTDLIITASQTVQGLKQTSPALMGDYVGGMAQPVKVYLGELRTDDEGRLEVLGGMGRSYSPAHNTTPPPVITSEFDSLDWIDDTSDGQVTVAVTYGATGESMPAPNNPAWVICGPPKYSWGARAPSSLYDLIEDVYERPKRAPNPANPYTVPDPVFYEDIWHLFESTWTLSWLNDDARMGHGAKGKFNFLNKETKLSSNASNSQDDREQVFSYIRLPVVSPGDDKNSQNYKDRQQQANGDYMPKLSGDNGGMPNRGGSDDPNAYASLTQLQYDRLQKWQAGAFTTGTKTTPPTNFDDIPIADQPKALTKAALDGTIGAALYPGIEVYWIAENSDVYNLAAQLNKTGPAVPLVPPFRIDPTAVKPGDLTRGLSLPWQTDFASCNTHWWPSNRPDNIVSPEYYQQIQAVTPEPANLPKALVKRELWTRGMRDDPDELEEGEKYWGCYDMVNNWASLAFVAKLDYGGSATNLPPIHVEGPRGPIHQLNPPDL